MQISMKLSDVQEKILQKIASERNTDVGTLCANEAPMQLIRNRCMQQSNELIMRDEYPADVLSALFPTAIGAASTAVSGATA